jgi:hypothetical protein
MLHHMRHPLLVPLVLVAAAVLAGCADGGDEPGSSASSAPSASAAPVGPAPSGSPEPGAGGVPSPIAQEDLPECDAIDALLLAALPAGAAGDPAGQGFDDPSIDVERSCGYRTGDAIVQVTLSAIPFTDTEMAALGQGPTVRASAIGDAAGLLVMSSDEMGDDAEPLNGSILAFDGSVSVSITARASSGERTDVPQALSIGSATDAAVQVHELVG